MAIKRHHESRWRDRSRCIDIVQQWTGEFGSPAVHTKRSIWGSETFQQIWLILPSPLENPFLDSVWKTVNFLEYPYSSNPFQPSYPLQQLPHIPQRVPHLQLHLFTFFHGLNDLHLSQGITGHLCHWLLPGFSFGGGLLRGSGYLIAGCM